MTREERTKAINMSFEAMLFAQDLMDEAQTPRQKGIAEALYEAHNALYWVLVEDRRREKQTAQDQQDPTSDSPPTIPQATGTQQGSG